MHNWRVLFEAVGKFVAMRRYEKMSVAVVIDRIADSHCAWATKHNAKPATGAHEPPQESQLRRRLVSLFFLWLMDHVIVDVLATSCYPPYFFPKMPQ